MTRGRITPEQVATVKARVPMPSLIGESIALRRETPTEYLALCPFHTEDSPSFRVYRDHAHCFGCGWHGDAIDWLIERERMSFPGALRHLRDWAGVAEPVEKELEVSCRRENPDWQPIVPIPENAPSLVGGGGIIRAFNPKRAGTSWEWTRWRPSLTHPYRLADGALAGYVLRVDKTNGGKFTPTLTFCQHKDSDERRWCVVPLPTPRPLYRIEELGRRPNATVLLVEGEKTADAAQRLLPSSLTMTWAGGAKAYHLTDFTALRGRKVVCVPDADAEGRAAFDGRVTHRGKAVPGILEIICGIGASARCVVPPASLPDGWDLANAEAERWDTARTLSWIKAHLAGIADAA
jgi:hypothetical protein